MLRRHRLWSMTRNTYVHYDPAQGT
jgi:hypothetical protein